MMISTHQVCHAELKTRMFTNLFFFIKSTSRNFDCGKGDIYNFKKFPVNKTHKHILWFNLQAIIFNYLTVTASSFNIHISFLSSLDIFRVRHSGLSRENINTAKRKCDLLQYIIKLNTPRRKKIMYTRSEPPYDQPIYPRHMINQFSCWKNILLSSLSRNQNAY